MDTKGNFLFNRFMSIMSNRLSNCKISEIKRIDTIETLREKYINSEIFEPLEDYEIEEELEEKDERTLVDIYAMIDEGKEIQLGIQMPRDERLMAMQRFFDGKNVFDDDEMINNDNNPFNTQGEYGRVPLHNAAIDGNVDTILYLIGEGANHELRDNNGHTPYTVAKLHNQSKAIAIFEQLGIFE